MVLTFTDEHIAADEVIADPERLDQLTIKLLEESRRTGRARSAGSSYATLTESLAENIESYSEEIRWTGTPEGWHRIAWYLRR